MPKKSTNNNLVTKDDIKKLATKEDLTNALKKYALKADLKRVEKSLRQEILKVEARTERVEEKVDILDKKLYRLACPHISRHNVQKI